MSDMCEHCRGSMPKYATNARWCSFDCRMHDQGSVENPEAFDAGMCDECTEKPRIKHSLYCDRRCKKDRRNKRRRHNRICVECGKTRVPKGFQKYCEGCSRKNNPELRRRMLYEWRVKPASIELIEKAPSSTKAYKRASSMKHLRNNREVVNARKRARRAQDRENGVKDEYNSNPAYNAFHKFHRMTKKLTERFMRTGDIRPNFFTKNGWDDSWMGCTTEEWYATLWSTEHNREYMERRGPHRLTVERDEQGFPVDYFYGDTEPRPGLKSAVCRYHLHHIKEKREWYDKMNVAKETGDMEEFKRLFKEANALSNMVYITEEEHIEIHKGDVNTMRGYSKRKVMGGAE